MRYSYLFGALLLYLYPVGAAKCNADNCGRDATGTYSGLQSQRLAACSSFQRCSVVSSTTECPSSVPTFASRCSGSSRYQSACSCAGITRSFVTGTTTTSTTATCPITTTVSTTTETSVSTTTDTTTVLSVAVPVTVTDITTVTDFSTITELSTVLSTITELTTVTEVTTIIVTSTPPALPIPSPPAIFSLQAVGTIYDGVFVDIGSFYTINDEYSPYLRTAEDSLSTAPSFTLTGGQLRRFGLAASVISRSVSATDANGPILLIDNTDTNGYSFLACAAVPEATGPGNTYVLQCNLPGTALTIISICPPSTLQNMRTFYLRISALVPSGCTQAPLRLLANS